MESTQIKPLAEVLTYTNEDILYRFMNHFDIDREESIDIFQEMLKWLWLIAIWEEQSKKENNGKIVPRRLFINDNLLIIDEMWHTFVLYTIDYREFCMKYFGFFIEHGPSKKAEIDAYNERAAKYPAKVREEVEIELKWRYGYVYDNLGEETLAKWHSLYSEKYSPEIINSLKKNTF